MRLKLALVRCLSGPWSQCTTVRVRFTLQRGTSALALSPTKNQSFQLDQGSSVTTLRLTMTAFTTPGPLSYNNSYYKIESKQQQSQLSTVGLTTMAEPQLNGPTSGVSGGGGDDPNKDNDGHDDFNKQQMKTPPSKKAPRKRQEGESDEASDASTAMTSTALTPMTVGSLASTQHPMMELERRDQLHQQMILLSLTTMATFAFFVTTIVPFTILVAFGLFGTSAGLLSYAGYQRLLIELQELAAGDGFAQLLPMGLVQTLTQTSIHEFMRDDTFFRE